MGDRCHRWRLHIGCQHWALDFNSIFWFRKKIEKNRAAWRERVRARRGRSTHQTYELGRYLPDRKRRWEFHPETALRRRKRNARLRLYAGQCCSKTSLREEAGDQFQVANKIQLCHSQSRL